MASKFAHQLRVLHWCTDQAMTAALESMELTCAQGHIMAYLNHQDQPPCPRDVELAFRLSHPTVSGLLQRLEQKGFIALDCDGADRRKKRIRVLEKGQQCHALMHKTILENEERLVCGFTPQEQAQFAEFLSRAISNMNPPKEEPK